VVISDPHTISNADLSLADRCENGESLPEYDMILYAYPKDLSTNSSECSEDDQAFRLGEEGRGAD
jgi:hypothetical protein